MNDGHEYTPKEGEVWILPTPSHTTIEVHVAKVDLAKKLVGYTSADNSEIRMIELHRFCAHFEPKPQTLTHGMVFPPSATK